MKNSILLFFATLLVNSAIAQSKTGSPDSTPIVMRTVAGSSQSSEEIKIHVYPSPTSGRITVKFESDGKIAEEVLVMDMQGRIILRDQLDGSSSFAKEINLEALDNGIYLLNIKNKEGVISTSRVVKTR
jgi:Secretion system C-terminal sorting domain